MRFSRDKAESDGEITRQLGLPDSGTVGDPAASSQSSQKVGGFVFHDLTINCLQRTMVAPTVPSYITEIHLTSLSNHLWLE